MPKITYTAEEAVELISRVHNDDSDIQEFDSNYSLTDSDNDLKNSIVEVREENASDSKIAFPMPTVIQTTMVI